MAFPVSGLWSINSRNVNADPGQAAKNEDFSSQQTCGLIWRRSFNPQSGWALDYESPIRVVIEISAPPDLNSQEEAGDDRNSIGWRCSRDVAFAQWDDIVWSAAAAWS